MSYIGYYSNYDVKDNEDGTVSAIAIMPHAGEIIATAKSEEELSKITRSLDVAYDRGIHQGRKDMSAIVIQNLGLV